MKLSLFFVIFLFITPIIIQTIDLGNITIKLPNVTFPKIAIWNQTRVNNILQSLRDIKISEIIKDRVGKIVNFVVDAVTKRIIRNLNQIFLNLTRNATI